MTKPLSVEVADARKHPFFVIDNDLIAVYGPKIGVYGIAVYNVLAFYANKKDTAWPSYQTIADHLGMSRPKVITTIDALVVYGLVKKEHRFTASGDKTSNNYVLVSIHEGSKQGLPRDKQDLLPSKPDELPSKQDLPRGSKPQITRGKRRIHEQDPMNKTHSFEQDPMNNVSFPAEKVATPQQEMFAAVCEAIGWDYHTLTKDDTGQVAQAVGVFMKHKYTVDDIRRFITEFWFKDWRWQKNQKPPTLKILRQEIGIIRSVMASAAPPVNQNGYETFKALARKDGVEL